MKQVGLLILIVGLLITAFAGYNYVSKKKVLEVGNLEITKERKNQIPDWTPIAGIALLVIGGAVYVFDTKK
jgi:hypothetical protein